MELTKREDAGITMLRRLAAVDPLTTFPQFESQVMELLLSRDVFLSQLNESERRKIVEITIAHDEKRQTTAWDVAIDVRVTRPAACILIGKTMLAAEYGPFMEAVSENEALKCFIEGWMRYPHEPNRIHDYIYLEYFYGNTPQLIIDFAKNYIND